MKKLSSLFTIALVASVLAGLLHVYQPIRNGVHNGLDKAIDTMDRNPTAVADWIKRHGG